MTDRTWRTQLRPVMLVSLLLPGVASGAAAAEPLSVIYGPTAATSEGDDDYREVIYLSVPDSTTERLYLRTYDPDAGGALDTRYGADWNTDVRYVLYGGTGAAVLPAAPVTSEAADKAGDVPASSGPTGTVLADATYGESETADDSWQTVGSFMPSAGEHVGGRFVFRLEATGLGGNDSNVFAATLSLRDRRDAAPAGLELLDYVPTVRIPDKNRATELALDVPADTERLVIHNFDAASGRIAFASADRTVELTASGQDEWRETSVELLPDERGATVSLLVAGGQEIPNDLTLFVTDGNGRLLPVRLQPTATVVNRRPLAVADHAPLADCSAIAFDASRSTDPDGQELQYLWEFGDGASASGPAVVHRYPGPGSYAATLRLRDTSGRIGNGTALPFEVTVKRPPMAEAGTDLVVAPGTVVDFDGTGSVAGDRPIASYAWDFRDGSQADGPTPSHTFTKSGTYVATLTVRDDRPGTCDSSTDQLVVSVNATPAAVPGPEQQVATGQVVKLDGSRSYDVDGKVASWTWDLGDGSTASGPAVEHTYAAPGAYTVTLTVADDADLANSSATAVTRILVNDPPVAEAGPSRDAAVGTLLTFDGTGSSDRDGKLVRYDWDFGNGAKGSGSEVRYAYDRPGTYQVTLTVTDDSASATSQDTSSLTITVNAPPVARAGDDQTVTASEVRFDGSGSSDPDGTIARYDWAFGDGTTGEGAQPVHVYRKSGDYQVRLTVTDDSGTERNSASDTLRVVVNQAPIADAGRDLLGAPGEELTLSGSGSIDPDGDIADYHWDFKDGTSASGERVVHRFEQPGVYDVQLTVRDDTGQADAIDFDKTKVVINAPPTANAGPDVLAAPGDEVVLDGRNSFDPDGRIGSYRWEMSDLSEPVTQATVTRTYTEPGVYGARLVVADDSGAINGIDQDELSIRINHRPTAQAGNDQFTSDTTLRFDGSASADADGDSLVYRWDFGDGTPPVGGAQVTHRYAEGGTYPVVLTVDDGTGLNNATAVAAVTVAIDRPPVADAGGNRDACAGDVIVFDGSRLADPEGGVLRYHWDFGDGTSAAIVNPTKTYLQGAVYPVTLTVEDDSGFPSNRHTDRVLVRVAESPIANAGPDQLVCANTEVGFDGSGSRDSDGVVNRFSWDFGDGSTGGGERPVHIFAKPGDYRVVLTIDGDVIGQCANTNASEMQVRVVDAPVGVIQAPDRIGVGAVASFDASASATTSGRIVAWEWDFGDGGKAQGATAEHSFAKPGLYVTTLTLRTEGGVEACKSVTARHPIVANAAPSADAGQDRVAAVGEELLFDASGSQDADGGIVTYAWDFGDGTTATGINARHNYRSSGRYDVTLTVTDNMDLPNSKVSDVTSVSVNQPPQPVIAAPAAACPGETLAFGAGGSKDTDGKIAEVTWSFGDGTTAAGTDVTHSYDTPGLYDVTLSVDDGAGLENSRSQATLPFRVNRQPRAEPGPDRLVCPGQEVAFDGSGSSDWDGKLTGFRWDFGDGATADGAQVVHRFTEPGSYDVRLAVTDDSGARCATSTAVAKVQVNATPIPSISGDRNGFVGGAHDELLLDASGSSHPDGAPLTFRWELGDGSVLAGDRIRHAFAKPGVYPVRLTASDGSGLACGEAVQQVEVDVRARP